jgi:hypothetical protein
VTLVDSGEARFAFSSVARPGTISPPSRPNRDTISASAQFPTVPEPLMPPAPIPLNIDKMKDLLRDYHDTQYAQDMAAVYVTAQKYVENAVEGEEPSGHHKHR